MASLEQRRDILKGRVDLNQLPPMQSRTVRVFVSSSSSELDMKAEREALATLVKPKLKKECLERYGIDFQMIDLRRNVPDKIVGQLNMRQLIAHEIKKCQDLSIGINFVALIGQKYGHTVLPPTVPMDTFTKLEQVMTDNSEALQMMEHCYFLDENKIPAEYVLRTKQEILQSMSFVTQSMTDWTTINKFLSRSIREAAERARSQKLITENEFTTFVESEISQQITDGLIKTPTTDNISFNFVINRIIQDVADHLDDPVVGDLIDVLLDEDDNVTVIDSFAANRLNSIKNAIKLNSEDTINLNVEWKSSSGNVDSNADVIVKKSQAFDEFESDSSDRQKTYEMDKAVNVDVYNHKEYINDLCKTFEHEIKKRIHKTLLTIGLQPKIEPLLSEVMYHLRVGLDCTHTLENRENCMSKIDAYVFDPNSAPLIVVGETGMGKSAILTETIHRTRRSLCDSVVIFREFGLTESSKYLQSTLITINQQIAEVLGKRYKAPLDFYTLVLDFQNYIYTWDSKTPLLLLLDGIENLKSDHNPCSLKWLPANLPSNVRVIITVPNKDHPILQSAKIMYGNEPLMLANFGSKEMMFIILEWLADAKMKLSDRQHQYARLGMRNPSSPLFLNLFFQELCKFRSYDFVNLVDNIFTTQSVIHKRFQKLEETYSACFVKHVLSIIALSKEGVTEHELEDILNMDGRLIEYLLLHAYCVMKEVPQILLSGLLKDLGPLIKIKQLYGSHLLMVSNEQVLEICKIIYINDVEFKLYVHSLISDFFIGYSSSSTSVSPKFRYSCPPSQPYERVAEDPIENSLQLFNIRKMIELPHHLERSDRHNELCDHVIYNYEYIRCRLHVTNAQALVEEYNTYARHPVLGDNTDISLLSTTLKYIAPFIQKSPDSLNVELAGRLSHMVSYSPHIATLITQCDMIGRHHCPLLPTFSVFGAMQPGVLVKINYNPKVSNYDIEKGLVVCTEDCNLVISKDVGAPSLSVWETSSGEKQRKIDLLIGTDSKIYNGLKLSANESQIVCCFHDPTFGFEVYNFIDGRILVCRQDADESGLHTISSITTNFVAFVNEHSVTRIFSLTTSEELTFIKGLQLPNACTPDEKYFIGLKYGKLTIYNTESGMKLCILRDADSASSIHFNKTSRRAIVGAHTGEIFVYNIGKITPGQPLAPIAEYPPADLSDDCQYLVKAVKNRLLTLTGVLLSPDGLYILADYRTTNEKKAIIWDIKGVEILSELTSPPAGNCSLFTNDSALVMRYSPNDQDSSDIYMYRVATGNLLLSCDLKKQILSMSASAVSNMVTAVTDNNVYVLDIQTLRSKQRARGKKRLVLEGQKFPAGFRFPRYADGCNFIYSSGSSESKLIYYDLLKNDFVTKQLKCAKKFSSNQKQTTRALTADGEKFMIMYEYVSLEKENEEYLVTNMLNHHSVKCNTNISKDHSIFHQNGYKSVQDGLENDTVVSPQKNGDHNVLSHDTRNGNGCVNYDLKKENEAYLTTECNIENSSGYNDCEENDEEESKNIGEYMENDKRILDGVFGIVEGIMEDAWRESMFEVREHLKINLLKSNASDDGSDFIELTSIQDDIIGNLSTSSIPYLLKVSRQNTALSELSQDITRSPAVPRCIRSAPIETVDDVSPVLKDLPSTILRVFSAESGDHLYTMDLQRERIIGYSSKYIFTKFRGLRFVKTFIYNMNNGHRLQVLNENVNSMEFLPNGGIALLTGTSSNILKIYSGRNFTRLEARHNLGDYLEYIDAHRIVSFPLRAGVILIKFTPRLFPNRLRYCLFELKNFRPFIPILNVTGGFKDVSKNGRVGIDASLKVYNLETGDILQQISTSVETSGGRAMDIEPRFSDDSRYVIWMNRSDGTLNVVLNNNRNVQIVKCPLHTVSLKRALSAESRMYLTNGGRTVIIIDGERFMAFSLVDGTDPLREIKLSDPMYGDSAIRGKVLLEPVNLKMQYTTEHFIRQNKITVSDFVL